MSTNTILATAPLTTTNYILKATGTTIGNSLIFDNGSNAIGLGVTPSAWISTSKAFQLGNTASLIAPSSEAILGNNIFVDSTDNNKYITTNFASQYRQVNGQHIFYSAGSGTAGTTISFGTPKLTITAVGNVGIGVTPAAWASPAVGKVIQIGNRASLFSYNNSTTDLASNIYFDGGDYRYIESAYATLFRSASADGNFVFYNAVSGTAGGVVSLNERMRIQADGTVLAGTTSDTFFNGSVTGTGLFGANGFIAASRSSSTCAFFNRFTSTGDIVQFRYAGSNCGAISFNGANTILVPTSDQRLKENIVDAGSGIDKLSKIKIRAYDWIESGMHTDFGIVAQEIFEVAPECVSVGNDEIDENGKLKNPWCAQPYVLVSATVKAIQELNQIVKEQQAQIQNLQEQINILAK